MNLVSRLVLLLAVLTLAVGVAVSHPEKAHSQTSFSEDEALQRPVPLSPEALKALLETEAGRQGLAFANDSEEHNTAQLFRAAEVDLGDRNEVGAVVIGLCPMRGADQGWFWVVRSVHKNPKVVLCAGGSTLTLMRSKTHGYFDIRSVLSLASSRRDSVYRFDGRRYKLWKEKWTDTRD